jgi:hypothetical protein
MRCFFFDLRLVVARRDQEMMELTHPSLASPRYGDALYLYSGHSPIKNCRVHLRSMVENWRKGRGKNRTQV